MKSPTRATKIRLVVLFVAALVAVGIWSSNANAVQADSNQIIMTGHANYQVLDAHGTVLRSMRYNEQGTVTRDRITAAGIRAVHDKVTAFHKEAGVSTKSGCNKATIVNVGKTILGFTAFKWKTYGEWCHNRAKHKVYGPANHRAKPRTTYGFSGDGTEELKNSKVVLIRRYYPWKQLGKHAGYQYERQAKIMNTACPIPGVLCHHLNYPKNNLLMLSTGQFTWSTDDGKS